MPRRSLDGSIPAWDRLYETAASQAGYVSTEQAAEAGYSLPLLQYHVRTGRLERVRRGVLRLAHFPPSDHEDLVPLWLWAQKLGVFSHETALFLHDLSDVLPANRHLTVPASWASRRLRVPRSLVLHFADLGRKDSAWKGPVPVTAPLRTIVDCSADHVAPDLVRQAIDQGIRRGLFARATVRAALGRPATRRKKRDARA